MNRIQSILIVTAAAFSVSTAFAQTPSAPAQPAMSGMSGMQSTAAPSADPLVQKRNDNAMANKEYKDNKKSAKADYKQHVKAAKADRKQLKKDATSQEKAALSTQGTPTATAPVKN
jgi:hypothetical protein